jgi:hypothetical protein
LLNQVRIFFIFHLLEIHCSPGCPASGKAPLKQVSTTREVSAVEIKGGGISGATREVSVVEATTPNSTRVETIFLLKFTTTPTIYG